MIGYGKHLIVFPLDERLGSTIPDCIQANDVLSN